MGKIKNLTYPDWFHYSSHKMLLIYATFHLVQEVPIPPRSQYSSFLNYQSVLTTPTAQISEFSRFYCYACILFWHQIIIFSLPLKFSFKKKPIWLMYTPVLCIVKGFWCQRAMHLIILCLCIHLSSELLGNEKY